MESLEGVIGEEFTLSLEPITPLHVWSGEEVIMDIDFVIDGKSFKLIDLKRTAEESPQALERLLAAKGAQGIRSTIRDLHRKGLLKHSLEAEVKVREPLPDNAVVRMIHGTIVPASTLKGYIRTVIAHTLLKRDPNYKDLLNKGVDLRPKTDPIDVAVELENILFRSEVKLKKLRIYDVMSLLSISDPKVYSPKLSLRRFDIYEHVTSSLIGSQYVIALDSGKLEYKVQLLRAPNPLEKAIAKTIDPRNTWAEMWNKINKVIKGITRRELAGYLREFGCSLIEEEFSKIRSSSQDLRKKLGEYEDLLRRLQNELCTAEPAVGCAPMRLGFMTGHEAKTIAIFLKRNYPDLYDRVKQFMSKHLGHVWDSLTLKLTPDGDRLLGMGWCRACL